MLTMAVNCQSKRQSMVLRWLCDGYSLHGYVMARRHIANEMFIVTWWAAGKAVWQMLFVGWWTVDVSVSARVRLVSCGPSPMAGVSQCTLMPRCITAGCLLHAMQCIYSVIAGRRAAASGCWRAPAPRSQPTHPPADNSSHIIIVLSAPLSPCRQISVYMAWSVCMADQRGPGGGAAGLQTHRKGFLRLQRRPSSQQPTGSWHGASLPHTVRPPQGEEAGSRVLHLAFLLPAFLAALGGGAARLLLVLLPPRCMASGLGAAGGGAAGDAGGDGA